jgi:hypothetical protein
MASPAVLMDGIIKESPAFDSATYWIVLNKLLPILVMRLTEILENSPFG